MGKKKHQEYEFGGGKKVSKNNRSGSSKTKKNKDFQKVKLRAGKFRPKNLNETKLQFQTRSIFIREQIAKDYNTEKIDEIIIRLHHGTVAHKLTVLDTLKQRLNNDPSTWMNSSDNLIDSTTSLLSNEHVSLYRSSLECLKLILNRIQSSNTDPLAPFIPLVCQRLISLITNINDDIRERSLPFLELLLQHYSSTNKNNALSSQSLAVLESLLQQMTKMTRSDQKFIVNIETATSKTSSSKNWHSRMLEAIYELVEIYFNKNQIENNSYDQINSLEQQQENKQMIKLYDSFRYSESKPFRAIDNLFQDRSDLPKFSRVIDLLVNVLLQYWSEMRIHLHERQHYRDALLSMWLCMKILSKIMLPSSTDLNSLYYQYDIKQLIAKHASQLKKYLLKNFPFDEQLYGDFNTQNLKENVTIRRLNIKIIDVLSIYFPVENVQQTKETLLPKQFVTMINYMFDLLQKRNLTDNEARDTLMFVEKCITAFQDDELTTKSIEGIKFYLQLSTHSLRTHYVAFRILCDCIRQQLFKKLNSNSDLPANEMVWFVVQVIRSSEDVFNENEKEIILRQMTQIFTYRLEQFSKLFTEISLDYFAILKTSKGVQQHLLITWFDGLSPNQTLDSSVFLRIQQYVQWEILEYQSLQQFLSIIFRQYDVYGTQYCSLDELSLFLHQLMFSYKLDGYVSTENIKNNEYEYGLKFVKRTEAIVNKLQTLKSNHDDLFTALWTRLANDLTRSSKTLKWFEWCAIYLLYSIDQWIGPNTSIQTQMGAQFINVIKKCITYGIIEQHKSQNSYKNETEYLYHLILKCIRQSDDLKILLNKCLEFVQEQEIWAICKAILCAFTSLLNFALFSTFSYPSPLFRDLSANSQEKHPISTPIPQQCTLFLFYLTKQTTTIKKALFHVKTDMREYRLKRNSDPLSSFHERQNNLTKQFERAHQMLQNLKDFVTLGHFIQMNNEEDKKGNDERHYNNYIIPFLKLNKTRKEMRSIVDVLFQEGNNYGNQLFANRMLL
ncbi:unnamed protein product [Didymodactylos carnosus]|uniref:Pre-rRNA-processing protein Ipi1 N-terminal domain-containing protein n=1 Tax=Didymodactylos carnosus TaxID=1234261 RepID=A0A814HH23_9BILA|nr:unnamed protein product [Didymodactylos carnosus]CAF1008928.1 unnamed protein product [Didymodactylos carnosus]CAF3551006.1 unnamed protein product [Didymodactylos carnosus]CAF3781072.1 unnamed protein product [Didymodactylos carnosus]